MDPITQQEVLAAAGAGGGAKVYVDDVFSTWVQEGVNGSKTIPNGIDLAGEGGMVWHKNRTDSGGYSHHIHDTERSPQSGMPTSHRLSTDNNNQQLPDNDYLTSWNSNGYNFTGPPGYGTGESFVSWSFRKAPGFFDVVTYTGNGVAGRSVAHNLGSKPGMILVKRTDGTADWIVYHRSIGYEGFLILNSTNEEYQYSNRWHAEPDANNFYVGSGYNLNNNNNETYVAYIFAHDDAQFGTDEDESIIKCGTYTGGGSTSVEVNLGFEPQWVLIKSADTAYSWWILDNMRGISSGDDAGLNPNSNSAEQNSDLLDLTATGFKTGTNANANKQGDKFIYMAIRRPHKPPSAGTDVFAIDTWGGTSPSPPTFTSGFPVDIGLRIPTGSTNKTWGSRMQGIKFLYTNSAAVEDSATSFTWDYMNGWGSSTGTDSSYYSYMFKRAPGFMDVVAYSGTVTGNSDSQTVPHNLGVTPELMLVKRRSGSTQWHVYSDALPTPLTQILVLNDSGDALAASNAWGTSSSPTAPNANNFTVGYATGTGWVTAGDFVAYLFATLPGISKVGSYTGTGSALNIDCGFTNGARFVLIKRTDATGDWYVWDTTRGIVSGNDPYFVLNDGVAQVTNTDYIDPLNAGFTVTSSAPAALNASSGTYIFLAIA